MQQRRLLAPLVAALLVAPLGSVGAGEPPGGWTQAKRIKRVSDDLGHDAFVVNDRAHVAFAGHVGDDPNEVRLYYGTNAGEGAKWVFEVVKTFTSPGEMRPAIAVTGGVVHVVYQYQSNEQHVVEAATNTGGTWTAEVLAGPEGDAIASARTPDIAVPDGGVPTVVFVGAQAAPCPGDGDLYVSEYAEGSWTAPENVSANDSGCREHDSPALAGGAGGPHLVYRAVDPISGATSVHYRSGALTNDTDETVDPGDAGAIAELGVDVTSDDTGRPHAVYVTDEPAVMYAVRDADTWSTAPVLAGQGLTFTGDPSIAISSNGPAVAFTEVLEDGTSDALLGEDTTEGWNIKDLNREADSNRSPVIGPADGGRLHSVLIRATDRDSLMYLHEAPRAEVDFAVAGAEFRGGQDIDMSGDIDPATVREKVKIETQRFRDGAWGAFDMVRFRTRANGSFDYTHDGLPGGFKYRSRLIWGDTIDHLDGRTVWDNFQVNRKRAH